MPSVELSHSFHPEAKHCAEMLTLIPLQLLVILTDGFCERYSHPNRERCPRHLGPDPDMLSVPPQEDSTEDQPKGQNGLRWDSSVLKRQAAWPQNSSRCP